ncbi:MAG: class I SAM-dependent methyltransferase, partial [Pseudobdellovibrio sp.]
MSGKNSFWSTQIIKWEQQRYQSLWAHLLYSSLNYRQQYAAFILNQIPDNSSVVEVGCGSGILYGLIETHKKIKYTGIDISAEAISIAQKKYPNSNWLCKPVDQIHGIKSDYFISAGLLDWLNDTEIAELIEKNEFKYHLHSFSIRKNSWKNHVHSIFSYFTSFTKQISYKPRTFEKNNIQK